MEAPEYLHLRPGDTPPSLGEPTPFRVVVVIDAEVTSTWRNDVSRWLVDSGCLYMMAWGRGCSEWDDSVDWAELEKFDFGEIPNVSQVITTWHDELPIEEVFWFAGFCAIHHYVNIQKTYILHISNEKNADAMLRAFAAARSSPESP